MYFQQGGQQAQVMELIQQFAQMNQIDPKQLMQQLQQMSPEQQQQAIQQMAETLQQGGGQQPDMKQAAMAYGGYTTGMFAEGGEPNGDTNAGMAMGQIAAMHDKLSRLQKFITGPDTEVDPWVASKITLADDYLNSVADYMQYGEQQESENQMPGGNYEQQEMMANGGYTVTRSNDRKGKTHKVTGPDGKTVKYFGDSNLGQHPGNPKRKAAFYARHKKNLDGNPYFRAFARETWEEGGELDYAQYGKEKPRLYDPYSAKQAQSDQYTSMMNQYQGSSAKNLSNMYSGLEGNFQSMAMDKYRKELNRNFQSQQNLKQLNQLTGIAPKYSMDAGTGVISSQEPSFKTDDYARGGYVNNMYYAQAGMEVPRQEDFPDYNSYAAAMQEWEEMGHNDYRNSQAMMADSIPMAQPMMGIPPVQNTVASQSTLNPYEGTSVYDFLSAQNKAPDYASRKALAGQLGITNYRGTASQNLQMMKMLKETPDVLQSYVPSARSKGSSRTSTVLDQQNNPVQNELRNLQAQDSTNASKDTTAVKKVPILPKKQPNESEDKYIAKILAVVGSTAIAGGMGYLEHQAIVNQINSGAFNLSGAAKGKLTKAINGLRNSTAKTATEGVKGVADWFKGLDKPLQNMLKNLDAAEIPGALANTRPGTAAKSLETIKMLQESAAEASLLNNAETVNALSEAEAEAKALRSFNAQKAAAVRWGKPVPKFPKLPGAAAAQEGSGFMNALREARVAATDYPWLKNSLKFMKRVPRLQKGGEPDSMGENILEWIEPTGLLSWDDVARSYKDPNAKWWETGLEIAGAIPLFGKLGKGAKVLGKGAKAIGKIGKEAKVIKNVAEEAEALSKARKIWNGTKTGVETTLDWVTGAAPQRLIDQKLNPLTRFAGSLTENALKNSPKLSYVARGIQPFQQSQRFNKFAGDVTGWNLNSMRVPEAQLENVRLITPEGKIINTNTNDPKVLELMNKGMIDTAAGNYNSTAEGWNLKPGAKYKGGGSTFSGNAFYENGGTNNPGFRALPDYVQHQILSNMAYGGNTSAMRKKANFTKQKGGQVLDVTPEELETLRQQGYQFEIM